MPKKLPATDRFQVSCDCEAAQLGDIIAMLTKMGFQHVQYNLITSVQTFRNNVRKDDDGPPKPTSEQLLMQFIKDHPTFKANQASQYLAENGYSKNGSFYAINKLVANKILKSLGDGHYSRTDVKHLAPPKKKEKPRVMHDVPHPEAILRLARRNHGRVNIEGLRKYFKAEGRNVNSLHPALHDLVRGNLLSKLSSGAYEIVKPKPEVTADTINEVTNNG